MNLSQPLEGVPAPVIAQAWFEARLRDGGVIPWASEDPITVYELGEDREGEGARVIQLASGHDGEGVMSLASVTPHYLRRPPWALVIEAPGHVFTTDEALTSDPESFDLDKAREASNGPDAYPHRALRVTVITPAGIGGAIVAELSNGAPGPVVVGREDVNASDPVHHHGVALLGARRTPSITKRDVNAEVLEAIADYVASVAPGTDPVEWLATQDPSTVPPEIARRLRKIAERGIREAGLGELLRETLEDPDLD